MDDNVAALGQTKRDLAASFHYSERVVSGRRNLKHNLRIPAVGGPPADNRVAACVRRHQLGLRDRQTTDDKQGGDGDGHASTGEGFHHSTSPKDTPMVRKPGSGHGANAPPLPDTVFGTTARHTAAAQ